MDLLLEYVISFLTLKGDVVQMVELGIDTPHLQLCHVDTMHFDSFYICISNMPHHV